MDNCDTLNSRFYNIVKTQFPSPIQSNIMDRMKHRLRVKRKEMNEMKKKNDVWYNNRNMCEDRWVRNDNEICHMSS